MVVRLALHPDSVCDAVDSIEVDVWRPAPRMLVLEYGVMGAMVQLDLQAPAGGGRRDELWRHTCFEAFVLPGEGPGYLELNISPSTEWAAYLFDGYREGMRPALVAAPAISLAPLPERLGLRASFDLQGLDQLANDAPWRLGLSAVIEERDGRISYWALAHPAGRPDFHAADCFTLELQAPEDA